jgi:hypothetical protein
MTTPKLLTLAAMAMALAQEQQRISYNPTRLNVSPPAAATAAGYTTQTLASYMLASETDTAQTYPAGKKWYFFNFSQSPAASATVKFIGPYGAIIGANQALTTLSSAGSTGGTGWHGTAFGGGGYFNACLSFSPEQAWASNQGGGLWPAFWASSIENYSNPGIGDHWPGQVAGYVHFPELDFVEYDIAATTRANYVSTIHDWYGTSPYSNVSNGAGGGTSYSNTVITGPSSPGTHCYGALWIPATGSTSGTWTPYLDGVAQTGAAVSWTQYTNQAPPPGMTPWTFGIVDAQHLVLELTTGNNQPVTVLAVFVWQAGSGGNITQ